MVNPRALDEKNMFRAETGLWIGCFTVMVFLTTGGKWLDNIAGPFVAAVLFVWLFAVMLWLSFGVVRHAECLAIKLGEPYGTLILTLSVICIEVIMISAVMLTGGENPTIARDTMFSVLMIVLNGMLGLTLLLGGIRHHTQVYNLEGARSYLAVLVALAFLCLILPRFTTSASGGAPSHLMAIFLIFASISLYGVFLFLQSTRHSKFFKSPDHNEYEKEGYEHKGLIIRSVGYHAVLLVVTILPIVLLSKKIAKIIDYGIEQVQAPYALAGFVVAILVLSPEALAAIKAALNNQLQRTVNIALGSALATIGLTVPAVLVIGEVTGNFIELGLFYPDMVLLIATFFCASIVFGGQRTNTLAGAVHLILFFAYIILIFD